MIKYENTADRSEAGFTLVELAVVMIIIGLLIGGVLKGQELIANAEVTSTIAQVKGIDAATSTFQDKYDAFPGDMLAPVLRLPNCGAQCALLPGALGGDGRLNGSASLAVPFLENINFFIHLNAADLLTGVNATFNNPAAWGDTYPGAEVGGGFQAAWWGGGPGLGSAAGNNARQGHYLFLQLLGHAVTPIIGTTITPNQAFRIDNKLDDSLGNTGSVITTDDLCSIAGVYQEQLDVNMCDLAIRFQN